MSIGTVAPTRPRLDSLTSLRWWAAFAVFGHHFLNLAAVPAVVAGFAGFGHLGVTFFFVLSGFVLTWSWSAKVDAPTFYWRRFARIYPLHLLTLLIAIPVFYRAVAPADMPWIKPLDIGILLLSVFVIQGWWREPTILFSGNPAAWTLTVEAFFYALHPPIMLALKRVGRRGALIGVTAVLVIAFTMRFAMTQPGGSAVAGLPWPVLHLFEFVLGMCLAWAVRHGWLPKIPLSIPTVALIAWFCFLLGGPRFAWLTPLYTTFAPYTNEVVTTIFAVMIVAAARRDINGKTGWLGWRPLVALGEWSFAFYLIHATLLYICLEVFGFQAHGTLISAAWFVGTLALSIVAAWALHVFVERPVEKKLRAWQNGRREARAAASAV